MSKSYFSIRSFGLFLVLFVALGAATASAQTTQFTYQGRLTDSSLPASGSYDFQFKLYDALAGGSQVGGTLSPTNVTVTNGIFTVTLDFGSAVFPGANRWLDISVRLAGGGGFTTLSPRQPITSTPYAIKSLNSASADGLSVACVNCVASSQINSITSSQVTGQITASQITVPLNLSGNLAAAIFSGTNNGTGDGVLGTSNSTANNVAAVRGVISSIAPGVLSAGVRGINNGTSTLGVGVFGSHAGSGSGLLGQTVGGVGTYGYASSVTGNTSGVLGWSESATGRGVWGYANSVTGQSYGVLGESNSNTGRGVFGHALNTSGLTYGVYGVTESTAGTDAAGVYGESKSTSGDGVYGRASATTGQAYGVLGISDSVSGVGAFGAAASATGTTYGVYGNNLSNAGRGVYGLAQSVTGTTYGVHGESSSISGTGVYGQATSVSGRTLGVYGLSESTDGLNASGVYGESKSTGGNGVFAVASATTGTAYGVLATSASSSGVGVFGIAGSSTGTTYGLYGQNFSTSGRGVYGAAVTSTGLTYGVQGDNSSSSGIGVFGHATSATGATYGVQGVAESTAGTNATGVYGETKSSGGNGVWGVSNVTSTSSFAVYGTTNNASAYAGWFAGRVNVTGTLTKGGGAFKIDHPLDPENKYLYHSFVESPEMMNIYNGVATLDAGGQAEVKLPDWFEALNKDFRYQLTCIGGFAPVYISAKVKNNSFRIAGGQPGMEVSWQVTGVRHDAFAEKHRIPVEELKPEGEKGFYAHPDAFGQSEEKGLDWARDAEGMRRLRQPREQGTGPQKAIETPQTPARVSPPTRPIQIPRFDPVTPPVPPRGNN